uniref:Uncharacterized protein n=1 Tax=Megaselia scalaris TaxID=36166 RepID=T1GLC9_MEGSC
MKICLPRKRKILTNNSKNTVLSYCPFV